MTSPGHVLALVVALTCAGCADEPEPAEARRSVEASRTDVQTAVKDVAELLDGAGHPVGEVTGTWRVCSAEPTPSWRYSAGGTVTATPDAGADGVAAVAEALQTGGWVVETEGTDPEPHANLEKDGLRLTLGESRREPGTVALGVEDECVATTSDQDSLLGERDRVLG